MKNNSFPIIVMTRNENEFLLQCVESIIQTVKIPVEIYIIDNKSTDKKQHEILRHLENKYPVRVIRNRKNLWILGLNKTIEFIKNETSSNYFFLTDGDIDFSNCKVDDVCWLTYLIKKMDHNIMIGKIGLSLDWNYLKNEPNLVEILQQEQALYSEDKKINDMYVSPVDTTASIFRWDWSIENSSKFYPGHMQYLRPELYSCRTDKKILAEHLGWLKYQDDNYDKKNIDEKIICFTVLGGALKKEILIKGSIFPRIYHKMLSRTFKYFWLVRRFIVLFSYTKNKGRYYFDGQK